MMCSQRQLLSQHRISFIIWISSHSRCCVSYDWLSFSSLSLDSHSSNALVLHLMDLESRKIAFLCLPHHCVSEALSCVQERLDLWLVIGSSFIWTLHHSWIKELESQGKDGESIILSLHHFMDIGS